MRDVRDGRWSPVLDGGSWWLAINGRVWGPLPYNFTPDDLDRMVEPFGGRVDGISWRRRLARWWLRPR